MLAVSVADPELASPWANTLKAVWPADVGMLNEPVPMSPARAASLMTAGLLLKICTGFPVDPGDSVMVIGISRFCPTVPPVIVTKLVPAGMKISGMLADALSWGLLESFTVTFTVYSAAVLISGVPLITPVVELIVSPAGNPDADHNM